MKITTVGNTVIGRLKSLLERKKLPFTGKEEITTKEVKNRSFNAFNSKRKQLEKAKEEYNLAILDYNSEGESLNEDLIRLYELRKQSVNRIQEIHDYLNRLQNCDSILLNSMELAWNYISVFRAVVKWEEEDAAFEETNEDLNIYIAAYETVFGKKPNNQMAISKSDKGHPDAAKSGLAVGAVVSATLSSLVAIASTTYAAGGATAFSLLSLGGPIGPIIGGAVMIATGVKANNEAVKAIDEINDKIKKIKSNQKSIQKKHKLLNLLLSTTVELKSRIDIGNLSKYSKDYLSDEFPHQDIQKLVDDCKVMGKLINQRIQ